MAGAARNLTEVYVAYGLGVALGVGLSYVPVLSTIQRWFIRRRGFASGVAVSGIGVGTLVMPPLAALMVEALGWRGAYFMLGGLAVVAGAGMALLIVNNPRDRGAGPDGDPMPAGAQFEQPKGFGVAAAIRSPQFIGLYMACLLCSFGVFVPFAHLVPYAMDLGIAPSTAVYLLAMIGLGSTAGRFLLGGFADRFGRPASLLAMFVGMALAMMIWLFANDLWLLVIFALAYGIFYGGWVAVLPAVVMDYFGAPKVGSLIGILYTSVALGTLIGPTAAGFAFDLSQSYTLPLLVSVCANITAIVIVLGTSRIPLRQLSNA